VFTNRGGMVDELRIERFMIAHSAGDGGLGKGCP
jgi:hypothetical protein